MNSPTLFPVASGLQEILKPTLAEEIPSEIHALFEVARGALAYGFFFYPLYTLAGEQLFRVAEAAVTQKCKMLGGPKPKEDFKKKVDWLISKGIIPRSERETWDAIRFLRNKTSHPEDQSIWPPGPVIGRLDRIAEMINALFRHVEGTTDAKKSKVAQIVPPS